MRDKKWSDGEPWSASVEVTWIQSTLRIRCHFWEKWYRAYDPVTGACIWGVLSQSFKQPFPGWGIWQAFFLVSSPILFKDWNSTLQTHEIFYQTTDLNNVSSCRSETHALFVISHHEEGLCTCFIWENLLETGTKSDHSLVLSRSMLNGVWCCLLAFWLRLHHPTNAKKKKLCYRNVTDGEAYG